MNDRIRSALVIAGVIFLVLGILWLRSCNAERKANAEAELQRNRSDAAIKSGSDAVETIGNAQVREQKTQDTVEQGKREIENAEPGNSNDAADRAACRMPSYAHHPRCIALQ